MLRIKRIKCPYCGQIISSIYFWIPYIKNTCPNCKKRIKMHPIVRLHSIIFAICMTGLYHLLKKYVEPLYLIGIIVIIAGVIFFLHLPRTDKAVKKKWVRKRVEKIRKIGY